jgi:hypothetical protein
MTNEGPQFGPKVKRTVQVAEDRLIDLGITVEELLQAVAHLAVLSRKDPVIYAAATPSFAVIGKLVNNWQALRDDANSRLGREVA